ncbi:hypothetical protein AAW51_2522 [Caldimonas brevitalea]|uniref:Uncharacterized protein n=1 Tax=Caldimonas brevitalea TaxID=413882 RepID=A0A0G3BMJ9_9BURK|nr:hypothetical protein AAW51_2522 [Caldimonas brevitalea]
MAVFDTPQVLRQRLRIRFALIPRDSATAAIDTPG